MALDSSGERLALSYKNGDEKYAGLIAVYDVRRAPLVSVSLMWVHGYLICYILLLCYLF